MGLIKVALGAVGEVISDQYKEFYTMDSFSDDILVKRARRNTNGRTANNGNEDIISNGSLIIIHDGQAMALVDQGEVVEFSAVPGHFVYNSSTEPSIFEGSLGENIKNTFKAMGRRIAFGGNTAHDQRIYYFNLKEIKNNLYGTPTPVMFRAVDKNIGLDMEVDLKCNGSFTYFLENPILFYKKLCANIKDEFNRKEIAGLLRDTFVTALQPALGKVAQLQIRPAQISDHIPELCAALKESLKTEWTERGIRLGEVYMNPPSMPDDQRETFRKLQTRAVLRNADMAAATLAEAQAEAMKTAAGNENGAMMGFMGMNMAQMTGGMNAQNLYQMSAQQKQQEQQMAQMQAQQQAAANTWTCACGAKATGKFCPECGAKKPEPKPAGDSWTCACGTVNTGKFCLECGKPKPVETEGWTCTCGAVNKGKFCPECGAKKPADAPLYRCDKCGWEPKDPKHPPRFCPECGDPFDDSDIQ